MSEPQSYAEQASNVLYQLNQDIEACDFKWSLFVSASRSYRYDSRLSPYPTQFVSATEKFDIDQILSLIAKVPSFIILRRLLRQPNHGATPADVIELLHWVLCKLIDPVLQSIPKKQFTEVLQKVVSVTPALMPTHIFQVKPQPGSMADIKFERHADNKSTRFAFHGSNLDSFHSIMNHGLQQHLSKVALFGNGIYLSSEMQVSLPFSPISASWDASHLGKEASCMALCEFVEHAEHLKFHTQENGSNNSGVPDKYFVITNNEIVRLRYLVVFARYPAILNEESGTISWLVTHKAIIIMVFYVVLLAAIGLANSRNGVYFRHVLWQKIVRLFESIGEDAYGHAATTR